MITGKKFKKISKAGSVTIPADLRRDFGIQEGAGFDISVTDSAIILEKHTPTCVFCGEYSTKKHLGRDICDSCCEAIGKGV